jgi:hypothetical protein
MNLIETIEKIEEEYHKGYLSFEEADILKERARHRVSLNTLFHEIEE